MVGIKLPLHLLLRQNLPLASFTQAQHAQQYVLPGFMICLIQRLSMSMGRLLYRGHGATIVLLFRNLTYDKSTGSKSHEYC